MQDSPRNIAILRLQAFIPTRSSKRIDASLRASVTPITRLATSARRSSRLPIVPLRSPGPAPAPRGRAKNQSHLLPVALKCKPTSPINVPRPFRDADLQPCTSLKRWCIGHRVDERRCCRRRTSAANPGSSPTSASLRYCWNATDRMEPVVAARLARLLREKVRSSACRDDAAGYARTATAERHRMVGMVVRAGMHHQRSTADFRQRLDAWCEHRVGRRSV